MLIFRSLDLERMLIWQKFFLWKSAIFQSIKLPFDVEVDEKFLNVNYYISTYMIFLLPFSDFHHMSEVSLTIQTMGNLTKRVLDLLKYGFCNKVISERWNSDQLNTFTTYLSSLLGVIAIVFSNHVQKWGQICCESGQLVRVSFFRNDFVTKSIL